MPVRSWIVAIAYALWLFVAWLGFWQVGGNDQNAQQLALALGIIPAAMQFYLVGIDPLGLASPVKFSFVLVFVVLASYWNAPDNVVSWQPVIQVCNLVFALTVAIMVAGSRDRSLLPKIAIAYSTISGLALIYVNVYGQYVWGRLSENLQPNWWGLVGLSVAVAGFGAKRTLPFGLFGVGMGMLTAYDASARGSMVGFICAALVLSLTSIPALRGRRLMRVLVLSACALAAVMVFEPYLPDVAKSAADAVFKVDDPYRGLGTGFTGREALWDAAIDIWKAHPLLGAGWHQQDALLQVGAHNSYLAILADLGICGLALYVSLLAWSLLAGFSVPDDRVRRLVVGVVGAYIGLGFFEARAFSVGQPLSLLFYMCAFFAIADHSRGIVARQLKTTQEITA